MYANAVNRGALNNPDKAGGWVGLGILTGSGGNRVNTGFMGRSLKTYSRLR